MFGKHVFYKELFQLLVTHFSVRLQKYRSSSSSCDWNVSPLILPPGIQMTLDFFSNAGFGMVKQTNNYLPHSSEHQMSNLVKGQDTKKNKKPVTNVILICFCLLETPTPIKFGLLITFFSRRKKIVFGKRSSTFHPSNISNSHWNSFNIWYLYKLKMFGTCWPLNTWSLGSVLWVLLCSAIWAVHTSDWICSRAEWDGLLWRGRPCDGSEAEELWTSDPSLPQLLCLYV